MKKADHIALLTICWTLIVFIPVAAHSELKVIPKTNLDPKVTTTSNNKTDLNARAVGLGLGSETDKVDPIKDGKVQISGSEKGVGINNLKEVSGDQKQINSAKDNIQGNEEDDSGKNEKPVKRTQAIEDTTEVEISAPLVKKEGSLVEICDVSNSCKVEMIGLVACLKVPGNESPELWLLVQNQGKGPLSVAISAPDFVQLEKTQIQLKENEDNKVKVSIVKAGPGNSIIITAGKSNCTLNFQGLITLKPNKEKIMSTADSLNHTNGRNRVIINIFIIVSALVLTASVLMSIFKRRSIANKHTKYQKLDMGLPVSGDANSKFVTSDGWDNSWGDDWDDEEAPKMPSMPLISSKGLAPRRLNKDGWKD